MSAEHNSVHSTQSESSHTEHQRIETQCIHAGLSPDPTTGAILTPIFQSTTFVQPRVGEDTGFTYSRSGNPTVAALERQLGALEGAEAACFGTGMAAITALLLATCCAGDLVVVSSVVYGGTTRVLRDVLARFGLRFRADPPQAIDPTGARLVLVETPANPTLVLTDIAKVAARCKAAGALLAVDNTFLTAALQQPLALGADFSVYSTTKYVEGHNSTVGGAVVGQDLEALRFVQNATGCGQKPWEAWLTLRGLKTLPLRMERHSESALALALFLQGHPRVRAVYHPLLREPELARRQQLHWGGMVAFEVEGDAVAVMNALQLCSLAENLGAVETLVTHPATMTHACVPPAQRLAAGISDGLIRLSVGLEHLDDLRADLERGLACAS